MGWQLERFSTPLADVMWFSATLSGEGQARYPQFCVLAATQLSALKIDRSAAGGHFQTARRGHCNA